MDIENAVCSENPNIAPEKKKRKRKKRKITSDVCNDKPQETTTVKDIPSEPPVNKSTELVPPMAEDTTEEPPATKRRKKKKKKKKKKKHNDADINTIVTASEDGASSKSTLIESSCPESVDSINSTTSSDRPILNTNLSCSKKKKKKKKRKRNHVLEVAGSNATELEENSLTPVQQSDFSNTANTSSLEKHEDNAQVDHVSLGLRNTITYKRKRSVNICPGNDLHLVENDGMNSTSAYCPDDTTTTSLETKPVVVDCVSSPAVEDIIAEKVSTNCPDVSMRDLVKGNCGDTSEGNLEKEIGTKLDNIHISSADVSHVDEDSGCKDSSSDNLSRGNLLNAIELELEKGPSSDTVVLEDGTNLNTPTKEGKLMRVGFSPERALVAPARKKLLILDVNGLLVEFVPYVPDKYKPDITISRKSVFKRPYCDEFLQFCFDKFNVGIWSSRTKKNIDLVVNFLMGDSRNKLMFCWDQSHCTTTGLYTIENNNKPLVLKELKKLWEKLEPDLPWEKGDYNATNTLLLDDSPYKALRNPVNTAIFPDSYHYRDRNDNSLGPGGDLRTYLEGLTVAENVQKYVKENPFGQRAITEAAPTWSFYSQILEPET